MKKTAFLSSAFLTTALVFTINSCGPKKIDPSALPITPEDKQVEQIPDVCKTAYKQAIPRVAVVDFTNNTTFDVAKVFQAQRNYQYKRGSAGAAGLVVAPGAVGVGYAEVEAGKGKEQMEAVSREVNAKLGESIAEGVAGQIVNMGGAKVYTRKDLQKILQEQQFQQSGLTDEKTLIKLGKLAGVRYIITGSVNNVTIKWVDLSSAKQAAQKYLGLAGALLAAGAETQEGWNIITDMTIKILDVQTGEVVFAKNVSGKEILGKTPTFNYDTLIGGVKKAAMDAVESVKPELSKYFKVRGYIIQLRTSPDKEKRYALINVGSKIGVKPGQEFYVYSFQSVTDPLSGKESCDMFKLPVTLEVSDQVQADKAWTIVEGEQNQIMRVKLGQLVERKPLD